MQLELKKRDTTNYWARPTLLKNDVKLHVIFAINVLGGRQFVGSGCFSAPAAIFKLTGTIDVFPHSPGVFVHPFYSGWHPGGRPTGVENTERANTARA